MNVKLVSILDRGNLEKERIHLVAVTDLNLSHYAIFSTVYTSETAIKVLERSCFWFAPKVVKANQNIVVYTRTGKSVEQKTAEGEVYHFLFRGLKSNLYEDPKSCAVIFELKTWATVK